ncbi:MAG: SLAC1 anion channel family protein [Deltaproteobacteria bacterium]|nr:SLAC1 anion channel family protein [Deltaproteobacteria bacterium]
MDHAAVSEESRLAHLPITLFGSVMGFAGLAIAVGRFEHVLHTGTALGQPLMWAVAGWFSALSLAYGAKTLLHPHHMLEELANPVRVNFFPAITISLLLLSIGFLESHPVTSQWLWSAGALGHLGFTLYVLRRWVMQDQKLAAFNPAWFIPVVGTLLVPVAGVAHAPAQVSWFFFSTGIVLWIVLFTIVMNRLIFHGPMPGKLLPTLFIMMAPPAVAFIAWVKLTGGLDAFGHVLYSFALFSALMLLAMAKDFLRLSFFMSWWAFTFPLAALLISTLLMHHLEPTGFTLALAWALLPAVVALVGMVALRTGIAASRGEVCVPE